MFKFPLMTSWSLYDVINLAIFCKFLKKLKLWGVTIQRPYDRLIWNFQELFKRTRVISLRNIRKFHSNMCIPRACKLSREKFSWFWHTLNLYCEIILNPLVLKLCMILNLYNNCKYTKFYDGLLQVTLAMYI